MFSRSALRAAAQGTRPAAPIRVAPTPVLSGKAPMGHGRRYISVYGYTQAKALMYSKYGEPKDVLR
jgi:trans-2-enoyl-CoA reductase